MKNELKQFAENILAGLEMIGKAKSAEQAVRESEAALASARNDEAASRALAAKRLQEADDHACAKIEAAEREADDIVREAGERADLEVEHATGVVSQLEQQTTSLEAEKDKLAADCASLRATIAELENCERVLVGNLNRIKDNLKSL